jgi:two-component system cell cycle response regulator
VEVLGNGNLSSTGPIVLLMAKRERAENRVLVVDDSPVYQHLIAAHLREWGFEVVPATDGAKAWDILRRPGSPVLALLDWVMPGMDGVELCRKLRTDAGREDYVYTILLTAKNSRADLLKAMEAGVDDFLGKPFDELELKARLLVGKRIVALQEELISTREGMRTAATYDALTGLLNRREIVACLSRELARAYRKKHPLTVILADLDYFKRINDQYGHLIGDEVLKLVAHDLMSGVRAYDRVGRYGGEEFLIVLPNCDLISAFTRADKIRALVSNKAIPAGTATTNITLSMGLAVADGLSIVEPAKLLQQADLGLYKAKHNGRNRVEQVDAPEPLRSR